MTYSMAVVLGVCAALIVDTVVLRTRLVRRLTFWATYAIVAGFQLISNGVLTGRRVVRYAPTAIIGLRVGYAPVEDLVFGFVVVLVTLSLWVWWGRRGVQAADPAPPPRWFSRRDGWPPRRGR